MADIGSVPRGTGGRGVFPRLPWNTWLFGSLAVVLGLWSSWTAFTQPPRPDPYRPATAVEKLLYPMQRNAFARDQAIRGDLAVVFAVPGSRTVWAGGEGGLLVRSDDGGVRWTRVSLASAFARQDSTAAAPADSGTTAAFRADDRPRFVGASVIPFASLVRQGPTPQRQDSTTRTGSVRFGLYRDQRGGLWCGPPLREGQAECDAEVGPSNGGESPGRGTLPSNMAPVPSNPSAGVNEQAQSSVPDPPAVSRADPSDIVYGETASSDSLDHISAIYFADAKRGWVGMHAGTMLETHDGGASWRRIPESVRNPQLRAASYALYGMRFTHRDTGWAAAVGGVLRYTRENGWWVAAFPMDSLQEEPAELVQIEPVNGTTAYAVCDGVDGREIWMTRDGARSWRRVQSLPAEDSTSFWYPRSIHMTGAGQGWLLMDTGEDSTLVFPGSGTETGFHLPGSSLSRIPHPDAIGFAGALRGAAVGRDGRFLYTVDGGRSWRPAETGAIRGVSRLLLDPDGRGWAVGAGGLVLTTGDGGRRWIVRSGGGDGLRAGAFAGASGWVVGMRGTLLASRDSGRTWRPRASGTDENLLSIHLSADGREGWAVGAGGAAIHMRDGRTWTPASLAPGLQQRPRDALAPDLTAVHFVDADRGWIAGNIGAMLATADGGATWDTLPGHPMYFAEAILFRSPRLGWIAGNEGVYRTEDGGRTWIRPDSAAPGWITSLHFLNDSVGWAAGVDGAILATRNGGRTWTPQPSGTRSVLTGIRFSDPGNGWAAGWDGTLLATRNGGASWLPEASGVGTDLSGMAQTQAGEPWVFGTGGLLLRRTDDGEWLRAAPPGRRWPGAWYLLVALPLTIAFGLLAVPARRPPAEPDPVDGILLSDRPLGPGDPDPLDLNRTARGISRFLRNEGTEPPLTIAVTGGWGSGKSSLMNLVRGDLARRGWRPVWFNAWHHQTEEHLLASLLENVRAQAVPPWLSLRGLAFRARLLAVRVRRNAAGAWAATAAAVLYAGYLTADPARIGRVREALTAAPEAGDGALALLERVATLLFPGDLAAAVLVYGVIGGCVALGRALRAFGVNPARLLATASRTVRLRELEEKPGFRHRFAVNFQEVTRALRPLDLVIFIDDLDRCRPRNVMTILEAVNFLVSSGECVVIMGMDAPRVIHSVAMELKSEAGAENPHDFARRYLEKLINIDVPVPTPEEAKLQLLLLPAPLPPPRSRTATLVHGAGRGARVTAPLLTAAAVLATVFLLGRWLSPPLPVAEPPAGLSPAAAAFVPQAPDGGGGVTRARDTLPAVASRAGAAGLPSRSGAVFTLAEPSGNEWLLAVGLVLTLGLVAWRMANRPEATTRDSDAFSRGRRAWMRYVASMQPTPRRSKKFMNRLRFYVMRQGSAAAPETLRERLVDWLFQKPRLGAALEARGFTRPRYAAGPERTLPEGVLVGLISLQEFQPELLRDSRFYRQFRARMAMLSGNREEVLEGLDYPASLTDEDRALFSALVEGVRIS